MFFKELCYALIRYSGICLLIRKFIARKKVTIILYHNPSVNKFEKHLEFISRRYNFISISDLGNALFSQNFKNLPKYALIITFDDGWKENYDLLQIIKEYKFKPTIFLTSHLINTERKFWWTICNIDERENLKRLPNDQRLLKLKDNFNFYQEKEFPCDRQALNTKEIQIMSEFVDFGLHSCFHPILTKCTKNEKGFEIIECRNKIKNILGRNVETFAYPNGDYDDECCEILLKNGIKMARTIDVGWNCNKSNPLKLKITGVSDNGSINKLASELTGIPMFIQYLLKGSIKGLKETL